MDGTCKEAEFQTGFDKLAKTITTNDAEIRNGLGQLADSIVWMPLYLCLCYIVALAVVFVAICAIVCLWCYLYYENSTLKKIFERFCLPPGPPGKRPVVSNQGDKPVCSSHAVGKACVDIIDGLEYDDCNQDEIINALGNYSDDI